MFKKALIALGLLGVVGLSGCVVVEPRHHHRYYRDEGYVYVEPPPVVIAPVFGFYGGYYHGYYGYRGGYHHGR
jgi:hypothetical protein